MDFKTLSVPERVRLLVESLDGAEKTNEALSQCEDGEGMIEVLIEAANKLNLRLSKDDLMTTPPIRDWIWWKNKEALVTIGTGSLRHQQDSASKTRWDSWTLDFFNLFRKKK
tara:strand:+ start:1558 stop:1893 length:336 start_codon:yes stop_codon:yes gene_type:complete